MNWLAPWYESSDASLVAELEREVCVGHPLWRLSVRLLARRQDCDDVLFEVEDRSGRVAVVHLTFSVEKDPRWPITEIFQSLEEFVARRMAPEHESWVD